MDLVVKVRFWKDCTPDFLTQIVLSLDIRVYMPDDYIVRRREIGSEMMMINRGYCKLSKPSRTDENMEDGHIATTKTMFSTYGFDQDHNMEVYNEYADDSSDDMSSDEEEQEIFGTGMFGASMNSRRFSGNVFGLPDDQLGDFIRVRRFQNAHPRRPSYPNDVGSKKSKKYREYLHPGQAFGEMSLLMNYKRTANIRAITFVETCVLSRKSFQKNISRYPEDRRRVLTAMLESCLEKNVIPFPWENIIEEASAKNRNNGKKDISHANVLATMTAKEEAQILVNTIDINAPDDTIKYGFQNFDLDFIDDTPLRQANLMSNDTLQRRISSVRSWKTIAGHNSIPDGFISQTSPTEVETEPSPTPSHDHSDETLTNLLQLVQGIAETIQRLQQDVSDLKSRDRRSCCGKCCRQRVVSSTRIIRQSPESEVLLKKEEHQHQTARKPSFVAGKRRFRRNSDTRTQ